MAIAMARIINKLTVRQCVYAKPVSLAAAADDSPWILKVLESTN